MLEVFLDDLLTLSKGYKDSYERKLLVIGVSCMLGADQIPGPVGMVLGKLVSILLKTLN